MHKDIWDFLYYIHDLVEVFSEIYIETYLLSSISVEYLNLSYFHIYCFFLTITAIFHTSSFQTTKTKER
jgi:hypothetical protein